MDSTIRLKYRLTIQDFMDYQFQFIKKPLLKMASLLNIVLLVILFVITGFRAGLDEWKWMVPVIIVVNGAMGALYFMLMRIVMGKSFGQDAAAHQYDVQLSDEGIRLQTDGTESSYAWSEVYKVAESRKRFFVYFAENMALIIPKDRHASALHALFKAHA
ncbi:YcxB family protein [Paenibacillus apiarius]|uniref:YcxB family protein n=1 Tax=Paenibacillus apiarius TaxID=46240 RepID=A0ABT4DWQ4_9BACL|nr:YcxB family protein [Paenibacillus apiarius]MBN3522910.1 YcxB family protein [Paenibacillus apiarius]MCY9515326.1 YcxB family protein [Paenibacillus apiarius]MCY9521782.1 YcxB family protein [Paenibacillus apiarius]MCY9550175.1 YcxB family protein [Paenibacillus apiarius]MCY9559451.1 YcxB family protein [Paenibacillus apiarius]